MDDTAGAVLIAPQVITTVVRQLAESTTGVARLATSLSGRMSRVLRGSRSASGVDVLVEDGAVTIDVYIIAMPNTALLPLGQTLQNEIHRAVFDGIGMAVRCVNVHFVDVQDPFDTAAS